MMADSDTAAPTSEQRLGASPADDGRQGVIFGQVFRFLAQARLHQLRRSRRADRDHAPRARRPEALGSEPLFLRALNFSMLLPGPEATELAIYVAWRMHGIAGGIVAGAFFVIPSIFVLLLLSWLSVAYTDVPVIRGLLYGVQPGVMAIVLDAVLRVGRRPLKHRLLYVFAIGAFVALFFLRVPFPITIGVAALAALLMQRWLPEVFRSAGHGPGRAPT